MTPRLLGYNDAHRFLRAALACVLNCGAREPVFAAMSPQTAPGEQSLEETLRIANQRFYAAFESLDLGEMEAVWAHDDAVQCVHPGWDLLLGWDEVRERWARVFANTKRVRIALSCVWVRVESETGWVACTEHITSAFADGFDDAIVQATNIFIRREGRWLLAAHHASTLPSPARSTVQ